MRMKFTSFLLGAAIVAAGFATPALSDAVDDWPNRAVTIVVPYAPGASNDLFARALADQLSRKYGQPFVVDNRPGGGGFVGANAVIRSEPDGYTLLEHNSVIVGLGPLQNLDFDPDRDLTAISMLAKSPNSVLVSKVSGITSMQELIDYSKANPENTFFGTASIGNVLHLHIERLMKVTGAEMKPVVYPSAAQMLVDLVAGRVHMLINTVSAALGQIESGDLRLLAYTDDGATASAPKAPTLKELGIDFSYSVWFGIWGPSGMNDRLTEKINAAINEAIQSDEFKALIERNGASLNLMSAGDFRDLIKEEADLVVTMMQESNIGK